MQINWDKIRVEYITTQKTYRQLAAEYGVSFRQLSRVASAEHWVEQRQQHTDRVTAETLDADADQKAIRAARISGAADKLLDRTVKMLDQSGLQAKDLRSLATVLIDLKSIHVIKSDADMREQEARIHALEMQSRRDMGSDDDEETGVILLAPRLGDDGDA